MMESIVWRWDMTRKLYCGTRPDWIRRTVRLICYHRPYVTTNVLNSQRSMIFQYRIYQERWPSKRMTMGFGIHPPRYVSIRIPPAYWSVPIKLRYWSIVSPKKCYDNFIITLRWSIVYRCSCPMAWIKFTHRLRMMRRFAYGTPVAAIPIVQSKYWKMQKTPSQWWIFPRRPPMFMKMIQSYERRPWTALYVPMTFDEACYNAIIMIVPWSV